MVPDAPIPPPDVGRADGTDEHGAVDGPGATAILLAWVVSIFGHVALFVAMFAMPWLSGMVGLYAEVPIAQTDLLAELHPQARPYPTEPIVPRTQVARDDAVRVTPRKFDLMPELHGSRRRDLSIIGIGTGGGEAGKYGLRIGAGEPGPTFFGIGRQARGARRIVYVVDRSGSMIDTIGAVQQELKRSIGAMRRSQRFHVIFYNSGEPLENEPKKLVSAAPAFKEQVFAFIDGVEAKGNTDPLEAIRRAFAVKPDLIYFLSDGEIPAAAELLALLEQLNKKAKVRVFTIAYVNPQGAELLEKIAREHGGEYRFVSEHELF